MGLAEIVQHEIEEYASGSGAHLIDYVLSDTKRQTYAVISFLTKDHPQAFRSQVVVMAHIEGDVVIIDADITDRPLVNELMRRGIAREQIVLAYLGETMPDITPQPTP
jgi:hypothetical protein